MYKIRALDEIKKCGSCFGRCTSGILHRVICKEHKDIFNIKQQDDEILAWIRNPKNIFEYETLYTMTKVRHGFNDEI